MLVSKIQDQLRPIATKEIESMLSTLKNAGATEAEAKYALQTLSQYGNIESIATTLQNLNIRGLANLNKDGSGITLEYGSGAVNANSAIKYIQEQKKQFNFNNTHQHGAKLGLILDEPTLKYLESLQAQELKAITENPDIEFINLEGWNNGANLFNLTSGKNKNIESNSVNIYKRAKKIQSETGLSFEEAFRQATNEDTLNRAANLGIQNVSTISSAKNTQTPSVETIKNNLSPYNYNSAQLQETIIQAKADELAKQMYRQSPEKQKLASDLILKYLNSQTDIYTFQRLGDKMIEINSDIENFIKKKTKSDGTPYTMDDVYYINPSPNKSYTPILLQYCNVNGIDPSHILYTNLSNIKLSTEERIYVAIDDVVGSGNSMLVQHDGIKYTFFDNDSESKIILAPIVASTSGTEKIKQEIAIKKRAGKDILLINNNQTQGIFNSNLARSLASDPSASDVLKKIIDTTGQSAFDFDHLAVMFPYMSPDNDSYLSSFFYDSLYLNPKECMKSYYKKAYSSIDYNEVNKRLQNLV